MRQKHEIFEQGLSYIPYPRHMRKMCLPNKIIPNMDIHNYFDKYYYAFISDLKKIILLIDWSYQGRDMKKATSDDTA